MIKIIFFLIWSIWSKKARLQLRNIFLQIKINRLNKKNQAELQELTRSSRRKVLRRYNTRQESPHLNQVIPSRE